MTLQPLSNMTDDELIAHMTKHIQQMEEEYPDQYHTILSEGMIYHIADMARRICSRPAPSTLEKDVLDLLKKKVSWGEEINRNQLFDYHAIGKMIEEAEIRAKSLRSKERE